jgi:hypothetical protein
MGVEDKSSVACSSIGGAPSDKVEAVASAGVVPMLIMGWSTPAEGDEVMRCDPLLKAAHLLGLLSFDLVDTLWPTTLEMTVWPLVFQQARTRFIICRQ